MWAGRIRLQCRTTVLGMREAPRGLAARSPTSHDCIPSPCARRMGPAIGIPRELHLLRLPRCLCVVLPMTTCLSNSRGVTLMSAVPTPSVLQVWFLFLKDAHVLPLLLDEFFVTSRVLSLVRVLAAIARQTVQGRLMGPVRKWVGTINHRICGVTVCRLGCKGGCGFARGLFCGGVAERDLNVDAAALVSELCCCIDPDSLHCLGGRTQSPKGG